MSHHPHDMADLGVLAGLAPELASTFASIASDIALVIDATGVIRSVAMSDMAVGRQADQWVGCQFIDTVTQDTRSKVELLLQEVQRTGVSRRREVNLPGAGGASIPVAFAAIRLGADGPVLAVGRDLRAIAAIQQRFLEAQQVLERDYWKQRQAESRYRQLFQVATDAVLVVDAATLSIVEANRAAAELWGCAPATLVGEPAAARIDRSARPAVAELLVTARTTGKPAEIRARLAGTAGAGVVLVDISATPFLAAGEGVNQLLLLVRLRTVERVDGENTRRLSEFVEQMPDAVAITDSLGRLQSVNPAFLALCASGATEQNLHGRALAEVLGDPEHRLVALVAEVRRNGIAAQVRAPIGLVQAAWTRSGPREVEVSAALLADGDQECIGFILRCPLPWADAPLQPVDDLAVAIEGLVAQLGRVSLPELMAEATHLAEQHLIRAALERCNGHLGTAAGRLGISADSLAQRLRRHGLAADGQAPPLLN